ncbi:hypothetical protein HJC23_009265 [Cyclotella cryptica]|uniref:Uncharacterized protein n=1 Tax=Cyclotella cryptica TaxID=29204 RepID=A0ABD3Q5G1_9STRA
MRPLHLLLVFSLTSALRCSNADGSTTSKNIGRSLQDKNPQDSYCGTSWPDAFESCPQSCPGGDDSECQSLGSSFQCYGYTGCTAKLNEGGDSNSVQDVGNVEAGENDEANNYCGETWLDAMSSCAIPCPKGTECTIPGQSCYAATNCDVPLETLRSNILVTMAGPDRVMEGGDNEVFGQTMNDIIAEVAADQGIKLRGVDVEKQSVADRRMLHYVEKFSVAQRFLPSGSSALDVSMVVTGDYRPPPFVDLDAIAEDSINRDAKKVVSVLKDRGARAGSVFFERVNGISAVTMASATQRPTRAPTSKPTPQPSGPPTAKPSIEPSSASSEMPSMEPSRPVYNIIMTGSQNDLLLGGSTTSSYGYLFNMRTKSDAGVVLITRFDFYTYSTEEVVISLYSRIGNFKDFKSSTDGWDLIAQGPVQGKGIGRYTMIPEEIFTPVDIPGGGGERGTRAFYLTMTTMDLVYKTGVGTASDSAIQVDTPDLEIWEGEGVLTNPLPAPSDPMAPVYFRYPRNFLGTVYCSAYGRINELPCPDIPTQSPTLPQPSASPVTSLPSMAPVTEAPITPAPVVGSPAPIAPTFSPSFSPTISRNPTFTPTTIYPTSSPIVPMRANINVNLRNVPDRVMTEREYGKFLELILKFLQKYTEKSMAIEGIDLWHQQQVFVDASPNITWNATEATPAQQNKQRQLLEQEKLDQILAFKKKQKEHAAPQTAAMQVTLVLRISFTFLPENLLGKMAVVAIQDNESELIMLLREQSAFYSYFKTLDGITSDVVLELTLPPTTEPTALGFFLLNQQKDVVPDDSSGFGFGVMVGLAVGFLWFCLTGCSIVYLIKARTAMKEQRDLENLLKQSSSPAGETDNSSHNSTVPMGNDILSKDNAEKMAHQKSSLGTAGDSSRAIVIHKIDRTTESRPSKKTPDKKTKDRKSTKSPPGKRKTTIGRILEGSIGQVSSRGNPRNKSSAAGEHMRSSAEKALKEPKKNVSVRITRR